MNPPSAIENQDNPSVKPNTWWQWLIMYPALLIAIIGAGPQYFEWGISAKLGVFPDSPAEYIEQGKLWNKNADCALEQTAQKITNVSNIDIESTICPNGDVLLAIKEPLKGKVYRWVSLESIKPKRNVSNISIETPNTLYATTAFFPIYKSLSNSEISVICQEILSNKVIRIIQLTDGRCIKEKIDIYTGLVLSTESISCDASCSEL